ncbi:hypothetical protein JHW43_001720 [Diplocarpon mali]|nr:hypothetical protein JHW43_001720 [Diplocarpon mali]
MHHDEDIQDPARGLVYARYTGSRIAPVIVAGACVPHVHQAHHESRNQGRKICQLHFSGMLKQTPLYFNLRPNELLFYHPEDAKDLLGRRHVPEIQGWAETMIRLLSIELHVSIRGSNWPSISSECLDVETSYRQAAINLKIHIDNKPFAKAYFNLIKTLYDTETQHTKWLVLIDDDTFVPSFSHLVNTWRAIMTRPERS